jgi:hypothetical protein
VSGTLGQKLNGSMTWVGSLMNGASFSYQGTVTLDSGGYLKFTYGNGNGTATWLYPGGATGTASGTMYQYPGYYFTQTVPGTYVLDATSPSGGTLSVLGTGGTRSQVYGGSLGPDSGLFNLYSPTGSLLTDSGSLDPALSKIEGVVGNSYLGANSGAASLRLTSSDPTGLNVIVPGQVTLVPGGSYFLAIGGFTPSNAGPIQVSSFSSAGTVPTALTQTLLYSFSESYQGFRISAASTPFTLASVEGYGWGTIAGTGTGATLLPTSYTGTGYFVSQDLGTKASLTPMTPGWAGVTGSMTGTLSGNATAGQTLTGQMAFVGANSLGTTYNYQGNATLASNGTLVWNYYGNWTNVASGASGTASGQWTQVLGTYFEQTVNSGTFVQAEASTTIGGTTYASKTVQDVAPLGGTRTVGTSPSTATTTSYAGIRTSNQVTGNSPSGTPNLMVKGVVAGSPWQTRWGVATISGYGSPAGPTTGISGPVTLDPSPSGKLTGQFVDVIPNSAGQVRANVTVNLVSVPVDPAYPQTTSSFVQTVSGTVAQSPTSTITPPPPNPGSLTTPTPLAGTSTGLMSGNINANVILNSSAVSPTYVTASTTPMSAQIIGAVGGPAGGTQTGVASMHSLKGTGTNTRGLHHHGTATFQPGIPATTTTPAIPATLTTNLNGLNPSRTGVAAGQTGTVTVTPR